MNDASGLLWNFLVKLLKTCKTCSVFEWCVRPVLQFFREIAERMMHLACCNFFVKLQKNLYGFWNDELGLFCNFSWNCWKNDASGLYYNFLWNCWKTCKTYLVFEWCIRPVLQFFREIAKKICLLFWLMHMAYFAFACEIAENPCLVLQDAVWPVLQFFVKMLKPVFSFERCILACFSWTAESLMVSNVLVWTDMLFFVNCWILIDFFFLQFSWNCWKPHWLWITMAVWPVLQVLT